MAQSAIAHSWDSQGMGRAELHWGLGRRGEAALHTLVHHKQGARERGAQPASLCSAALQEGKAR